MKNERLGKGLAAVAAAVAVAGGLWQLSLVLRLWAGRVRYPFDIEWLESSALYQGYRVAHGLGTYGPPREGFLPLFHPPVYPALLGIIGRIVGLDYGSARTASITCFLVAAALVVRAAVRHAEGRIEGWAFGAVAVGVSAGGSPVFQGFYDLVREDVLAVAIATLAAVLACGRDKRLPQRRVVLLAAVLVTLLYTRQPAVFFGVFLVIFVFARHPPTGLLLALLSVAGAGLVLVGLEFASKGWYWMYTVALVQGQAVQAVRFALGLRIVTELWPFWVALPFLAGLLAALRKLSDQSILWMGMLVAAIPASLLPWAKVGGFANDFMPVLFFVGPATAFICLDVVAALAERPRLRLAAQSILCVATGAFLFVRTWDLKPFVPDEAMVRRARALDVKLRGLEGGMVAPRHPFLPAHEGKSTLGWSDMPYLDMLWSNFNDLDLGTYVDKGQARWAIVNGTEVPLTTREITTRFQLEERLPDPPVTLIGERSSPRYLLRANDDEKNGHVVFDFESLDGWTVTGNAFHLTTARPPGQYPITGVVGKHIANSYDPKGKDPARGTMVSPRFLIDRPHLSLRVGGGWRSGTRAELRVNGRPEKTATGIWETQETMTRVVWDVSNLQGKEAQLHLIDEDSGSWAHLLCDHVVLY